MSPGKSQTPLLDHLADLEEEARRVALRLQQVERDRRRTEEQLAQSREDLVEAFASGDDAEAEKVQKRRDAITADLENWRARVEGVRRAADRARVARDQFIVENHADLVAERRPGALAAAAALEQTLRAFVEACHAWQAEERAQIELLKPVPARDGRDIPQLPVASLFTDAKRALGGAFYPPLPEVSPPSVVGIAAEYDPDPEVREDARQKIKRKAAA